MKAEFKEKLLTALRSDTYTQVFGKLRCRDGHCIMGVVADLMGVEWDEPDDLSSFYVANYEGDCMISGLTSPMLAEIGMSEHVQNQLINRNDDHYSFLVLADYIEEVA